jgi:hypothetical protein
MAEKTPRLKDPKLTMRATALWRKGYDTMQISNRLIADGYREATEAAVANTLAALRELARSGVAA